MHKGNVIKLGDNIDTDIIIPTQYMTLKSVDEMIKYAFFPLRPEIPSILISGDIFVCGKNFGCGSSREQAPEIIKKLGAYCVIAKSYSRLFYRNAINNGLLLIQNTIIYDRVNDGDKISIDVPRNKIILNNLEKISFEKIPEMLIDMINKGGLVKYWKDRNKRTT